MADKPVEPQLPDACPTCGARWSCAHQAENDKPVEPTSLREIAEAIGLPPEAGEIASCNVVAHTARQLHHSLINLQDLVDGVRRYLRTETDDLLSLPAFGATSEMQEAQARGRYEAMVETLRRLDGIGVDGGISAALLAAESRETKEHDAMMLSHRDAVRSSLSDDAKPWFDMLMARSEAPSRAPEGWQPIATYQKPVGEVSWHGCGHGVIIATKNFNLWLVGEAFFVPNDGEGEWWWANTRDDEHASAIATTVEFWHPMPASPRPPTELEKETR